MIICCFLIYAVKIKLKLLRDPEINVHINKVTERLYLLIRLQLFFKFPQQLMMIAIASQNIYICQFEEYQNEKDLCIIGKIESELLYNWYVVYDVFETIVYTLEWFIMFQFFFEIGSVINLIN